MKGVTRTVESADDGIRLDRWFKRHYPGVPHGELQKAARKGLIRLDGKKTDLAVRIGAGQEVTVKYLDLSPRETKAPDKSTRLKLTPEQILETQSWVLFRNRDVMAINKPAGLATQGGSGMTDHLDARLQALCFDAPQRPKLVHRLDKDTSGVLLLARHAQAATALTKAFAAKRTQKLYWALIVGVPDAYTGEIEGALEKSEGNVEKMEVTADGKPAITRYRVLEALAKRLALVELEPVTGRTHQLRVHMAELGTPILGDGKYGGRAAFISGLELPRRLHLHARRLLLPQMELDVTAPLPPHMRESFDKLGLQEPE